MIDARGLSMVLEDINAVAVMKAIYREIGGKRTLFYSGDGQLALASLARSILIHEGGTVLVVKDAETRDLDKAEQSRGLTAFLIQQVADPSVFDVHAFVPELEVIFFEAPALLEQVLGEKISSTTLRHGKLIPKEMLKDLFGQNGKKSYAERLAAAINPATVPVLLQGPQMKKLDERIQALAHAKVPA